MGANARVEVQRQFVVTGAWLTGLLVGMRDPKTYPELKDVLGREPEDEPEEEEEMPPEAAHAGARLWIMYLNRGK